jgi:hypothetical protein
MKSCGEVAEVQGLAGSCGEDEVAVPPEASRLEPFGILSRLVHLECLDSPPREFYVATLPVLRRGEGGSLSNAASDQQVLRVSPILLGTMHGRDQIHSIHNVLTQAEWRYTPLMRLSALLIGGQ